MLGVSFDKVITLKSMFLYDNIFFRDTDRKSSSRFVWSKQLMTHSVGSKLPMMHLQMTQRICLALNYGVDVNLHLTLSLAVS